MLKLLNNKLFLILTVFFIGFQSEIYAQDGEEEVCNGIANSLMISNPGDIPPNFDMNLVCIDITYPECPGDGGSLDLEWEKIGDLGGLGRFQLINISDETVDPISSSMIVSSITSGTWDPSVPDPGLYNLIFQSFDGSDDIFYENNPIDLNSSENSVIVIGDPISISNPICDSDQGFFRILSITGGSPESNNSVDNFTFYVDEVDQGNIFDPVDGYTFNFADENGDGDVAGGEFTVTVIAVDNNSPCSGELNFTFPDPGNIESEVRIHHQSCPEEEDAYLELELINDDGTSEVELIWSEYDSLTNQYVFVSYQNNTYGDPDDLILDSNDGGLAGGVSVIYFEPDSIDGISTDFENDFFVDIFSGIGSVNGREFILEASYIDGSTNCTFIYENELEPLTIYRLLEPNLEQDSVIKIQPLCNELNGPPSPDGDPFEINDDDAGGIITFPLTALSGGDNLNEIFDIELGQDDWSFVLLKNGVEIQTFSTEDAVDEQITWENLEAGSYTIEILYPSIDIITSISFPGGDVSHEINTSFSNCNAIEYGEFILNEPEEITFDAEGISANYCNGELNGYPEITNIDGGTPYDTDSNLINPIESTNNSGYYEINVYDDQEENIGESIYNLEGDVISNGGKTYYVTLMDANGCESTPKSITIYEPDELDLSDSNIFSYTIDSLACYGDTNAVINFTFNPSESGPDGPFTYELIDSNGLIIDDGNDNPFDFTGLSAGTYELNIFDTDDYDELDLSTSTCAADTLITIDSIMPLSVFIDSITNVSCFQGSDGAVIYDITGGTAPYSYNESSGLVSGSYTDTIIDSNGCEAYIDFEITEPDLLEISSTIQNVSKRSGSVISKSI